ncbi:MAG: WD40/YVTN/BNR-like repeat-containing protein, partial [Chitinophagales bacterium]
MKKILLAAFIFLSVKCFSQPAYDSKIFGDIKARWLGPAVMSGRISCVDAVNNDVKTVYVGSASGGVWKSEDFGISFKPIFDKYTQSIGAITIDQKNPKTVWVGTGECWVRNSVSIGTDIYKTTDAGLNWTKMGLDSSERIARITISSKNSDVVYVAVPGPLWSDSKNRGVYKTSDGGKTWEKILFVDDKTGCADLAIDPQNPDIVYAAMWQFRRTPYSFSSGGPGSALYKSVDGGKTWKKLTNGLPTTDMGRIALGVSPSNPNIVYATIEYKESAMFKSSDKGEHWTRTGTSFSIIERPFYFARLICDPKDTNTVYRCGLSLVISRDGGKSFSNAGGGSHGDHHDVWINPSDPDNIMLCTDGGLYISHNQGGTYYLCRSLPVGQFYHVMYDMEDPYNVYGGLQDNLSWYGPSKTNTGGVGSKLWDPMSFGDGFWTFPDRADKNTAYTEIQGGVLIRYDKQRKILKQLSPHPGPNEPKYRFNWNSPFTASIHNTHKLFLGGQYVFVSYDQGETWKKISPDLTTNNPKYQQQESSGGVTADNSAAENHCTVYFIAESQSDSNIIWAGTDDGNIQLTKDGGKTWSNIEPNIKDAPKEPWVSSIETSHFDNGTAYVTLDYHNWGDMNPYVYKTTDYGQTCTKISNDSVRGYCHIIRE